MATQKAVETLLRRRGWVPVWDDIHMRDPLYIYPEIKGWIKPPSQRIHSMREAYEKEGFVYADL